MFIYSIIGNSLFGAKQWPKWAKWPLKIAALIQEIWAKRGERHAFILPLIGKSAKSWTGFTLRSLNSLMTCSEQSSLGRVML